MGKFIEGNEVGKDTQFKPGESGNPIGLPKGYKTFKTRIQEIAEKEIDFTDLNDKKIKGSVGDGIIMALCAKALMGDVVAAKALMEHAEAKKIELSGDEENPVKIESKVEMNIFKKVVKETLDEF